MSTATLSEKDTRVRNAVLQQLEWDPAVDASGIGITARDGAVTLTGSIDSYAGKLAAERAAKRVHGCAPWRTTSTSGPPSAAPTPTLPRTRQRC